MFACRGICGYLGWHYGCTAVFLLAAVFRAISVACIMIIPRDTMDDRAAHDKEAIPKVAAESIYRLVKHKPLLVAALALTASHLGDAAIIPLYGLSSNHKQPREHSTLAATTIVVAQAVMILTSIIGMQTAKKPRLLTTSFFLHSWLTSAESRVFSHGIVARSLYMMSGDARRIWEHSIPAVEVAAILDHVSDHEQGS